MTSNKPIIHAVRSSLEPSRWWIVIDERVVPNVWIQQGSLYDQDVPYYEIIGFQVRDMKENFFESAQEAAVAYFLYKI